MKVFISWSGEESRRYAEVLRDWIAPAFQRIQPYYTPNDIERGARWDTEISKELENSDFGILCMTSENIDAPWILFEAGALSKRVSNSRVCPLLFNIDKTDVEPPLSSFQLTNFNESEFQDLLKTMNSACGDEALDATSFESVFDNWWPRIVSSISEIQTSFSESEPTPIRSDRSLLEEILESVRSISVRSIYPTIIGDSSFIQTMLAHIISTSVITPPESKLKLQIIDFAKHLESFLRDNREDTPILGAVIGKPAVQELWKRHIDDRTYKDFLSEQKLLYPRDNEKPRNKTQADDKNKPPL